MAPPPFVAEPVVGWRVWQLVDRRGGEPLLYPAGMGRGPWRPRAATVARCHAKREPGASKGHRPPTMSCTCGIYASDSLRSFMRVPRPAHTSVIGQVSLWGKVIEHELGFRAKFAYPSRLRLICVVCLRDGRGEATPYLVHRFPDGRMLAACRTHREAIPHGAILEPDDAQATLLSAYAVDLLPAEALRPRFSFPQPAPTVYQLGWAPIEELRALSRDVPRDVGDPPATVAPSVPTASPPVASVPVVKSRPAAPAPAALPPPQPTFVHRTLEMVGTVIAWIVQWAFFLFLFYVGCASEFTVIEVPREAPAPAVAPAPYDVSPLPEVGAPAPFVEELP